MKCKYERCIDKVEKWLFKEKKRLYLSMVENDQEEHIKHVEGQMRALNNVSSIIHNYKLKADKMKI